LIANDNRVTCAIYGRENGLLDLQGWRKFKLITIREKKFSRMVNQTKHRSFIVSPRFKNGFKIPTRYDQSIQIDESNGKIKFQDATELELQQMRDY
jgi:hypothetical protein